MVAGRCSASGRSKSGRFRSRARGVLAEFFDSVERTFPTVAQNQGPKRFFLGIEAAVARINHLSEMSLVTNHAAQRQGARRWGLTDGSISRARNSTIRRPGLGRPPAASPPRAMATRRHCCPTARCSSQAVMNSAAISRARNSTIRRAGPGRPPAASPPHAIVTRRRCCPTARCSSQAVTDGGILASAELYDPASGTWTATGSLATATLSSHGDVAAQRQGARRGRF